MSLASGPSPSLAAPVPGAVATYTCCDGYEPLLGGALAALECMPDGNWNDTPPVCVAEEAGSPCKHAVLSIVIGRGQRREVGGELVGCYACMHACVREWNLSITGPRIFVLIPFERYPYFRGV